MPVFSGLVRGDRRTNIIPGAKVEDEARIHKNQVSGEMEAVGSTMEQGTRLSRTLDYRRKTSSALFSSDLPKEAAYTHKLKE